MTWSDYSVFHAFLLLIIIMGPFTGLPVFLKITQNFDRRKRLKSANKAIGFAGALLVFFVIFGEGMLAFFGISFEGFRVAGGIILLLLGIEYMFHISFKEKRSEKYNTDIIVPFAMPLIIGPGVITTTILLTKQVGHIPTLIGGIIALAIYWLFLRFSDHIEHALGEQGIEVIARFMGLLLMAIAVDMMKAGIAGFIARGLGMG
jgi:multiple antibiotic resistance protein